MMGYFSQFRRSLSVAKKSLRIYYIKGPVLIFGMLLPFFFFLAFWLGRDMSAIMLGTGLVGMATWFTSTSISPVITPWETRTKTLERLVSSPINQWGILLGDLLASALIGIVMTVIPLSIAFLFLEITLVNPITLILGILLASLSFSSVGVLMAAIPTDTPADVMMLSTLVKFPLVFISGIFIQICNLPRWGKAISYFSPLSYLTEVVRQSFGAESSFIFTPLQDILILIVFFFIFFALAIVAHRRTLPKRI